MIRVPVSGETEVLSRVAVRLLREEERPEFDRLLQEKHYLHDWVLTGQSLRYVAELDGQWVALLAFSAASFHLKAREGWIGANLQCFGDRFCFILCVERHAVLALLIAVAIPKSLAPEINSL